jgi:hypothetical protein
MSISSNNNSIERRGNPFFAVRSRSEGVLIISLALTLLLLAGGGFTLIGPTTISATPSSRNITITPSSPSSSSSAGLNFSAQPVWQERERTLSDTPINQTHLSVTFSGNGTLTLPNSTAQPINFSSNGTVLVSFITHAAQGKETIRTQGGETATATFHSISQFNPSTNESKGIVIAAVAVNTTNSTTTGGSVMLAPLNGMILAGIDDFQSNGAGVRTFWKWESGIGDNSSGIAAAAAPPMQTQQREGGAEQTKCDSSYPDVCIPPPPPDLDCGDVSYHNFEVRSPDPHGFDKDNDGIGCER